MDEQLQISRDSLPFKKNQPPIKREFPASVRNLAFKQVYTNLTPFLNENNYIAQNHDDVEDSAYDSAYYVSERIIDQVMKAIDIEEEVPMMDLPKKAAKDKNRLSIVFNTLEQSQLNIVNN